MQTSRGQGEPVGNACPEPDALNLGDRDGKMEEGEVMIQEAHVPPFSKKLKNSSPTDLPPRKKHKAVLPQLLNADPLAQIIGTETIADVIIDDAEVSLCGHMKNIANKCCNPSVCRLLQHSFVISLH